ncbi:hypothetical protein H8L47_17160 [Undibacterium sp. NL8W]|uniref:Uncharacterized protein n=1 Tax=Undibacterium umbellatum TaxID=2762300 RepID=A0ABR6ZC09_9BURK|nr:hypothetical protein [Undibacterium umbellatum]
MPIIANVLMLLMLQIPIAGQAPFHPGFYQIDPYLLGYTVNLCNSQQHLYGTGKSFLLYELQICHA